MRASAAAIGEPLPQVTSEGVLEDAPVETQATEDPADFVLPTPSEVHIHHNTPLLRRILSAGVLDLTDDAHLRIRWNLVAGGA